MYREAQRAPPNVNTNGGVEDTGTGGTSQRGVLHHPTPFPPRMMWVRYSYASRCVDGHGQAVLDVEDHIYQRLLPEESILHEWAATQPSLDRRDLDAVHYVYASCGELLDYRLPMSALLQGDFPVILSTLEEGEQPFTEHGSGQGTTESSLRTGSTTTGTGTRTLSTETTTGSSSVHSGFAAVSDAK